MEVCVTVCGDEGTGFVGCNVGMKGRGSWAVF